MLQVGDTFECVAYGKLQEGKILEFDKVVEGNVYLSGIVDSQGIAIENYLTNIEVQTKRVEYYKFVGEMRKLKKMTKNSFLEFVGIMLMMTIFLLVVFSI